MKRIGTIFFIFLLLSSSGGLVLSKHFCGGELMEAGFFKEFHSCCGGDTESSSDCCDLENEVIQHDDNTQASFQIIDPPEQLLVEVIAFPRLDQGFTKTTFVYHTYLNHPLTVPDRLSRFQSFLL